MADERVRPAPVGRHGNLLLHQAEYAIPSGTVMLFGDLDARGRYGTIVFAHGDGSGAGSARDIEMARHLQQGGFTTLLVDLLSPGEAVADERTPRQRFDAPLLADRLVAVTDWLSAREPRDQPIGYIGAGTGASAALIAAAQRPDVARAMVSCAGRLDLADTALAAVRAPTLLLVGDRDEHLLALNRVAYAALACAPRRELVVIPGAAQLLEEPGAMDQAAECAVEWFDEHVRWR